MEKKQRRTPRRKATEMVDFAKYPALHDWIVERAARYHRTISEEIAFRLETQMRNSLKGTKNLKHEGTD